MNWGWGITITLLGFIGFMATLVVVSVKQDYYLESPDYYKQELAYQDQIDKQTSTRDDKATPSLSIVRTDQKAMQIHLPQGKAKGTIRFKRASNAHLDFQLALAPDSNGDQTIAIADKLPGPWTVVLDWENDGKAYSHKQTIVF